MIYIDPTTLRRTTVATATTAGQDNAITMTTTASQLSRGFGILVRQIADLCTMLQDYSELAPNLPRVLLISEDEATSLQVIITITWLINYYNCLINKNGEGIIA